MSSGNHAPNHYRSLSLWRFGTAEDGGITSLEGQGQGVGEKLKSDMRRGGGAFEADEA